MLPNSLFLIKSCLACGIHLQAPSPGFPGKIKFLASLGTRHTCAWLLHFAGELTLSAALQKNGTEMRRQKQAIQSPVSTPARYETASGPRASVDCGAVIRAGDTSLASGDCRMEVVTKLCQGPTSTVSQS